jgi:hypothetical protein
MSNQGDATTSLLPIYILNTFHSLPRALIKQMAHTKQTTCKFTGGKAPHTKASKAAHNAVHHQGDKEATSLISWHCCALQNPSL